jgi:Flp pilus assembly protein TadG
MRFRAKLHRQDGAAAVEFALIVGVLAMLIFGMLQFGVAFFQLQNLRAAAREGARVGAVGATVLGVKKQTTDSSLGALQPKAPPYSPAITVTYASDGTNFKPIPGGDSARACPTADQQTTFSSVRVNVDPNLDQALTDTFTINIPLMPPIPLKPTINGVFRCEGN